MLYTAMPVSSFRDLRVWQNGIDLVACVYELTRSFPKHETYGLSSQIQRAAVSVPANIAEGHQRDSTREFLHHVSFGLASLAELETHLIISERLGYCSARQLASLLVNIHELGRMIRALQKSLKAGLSG
jgi:four helix bundle protein